MKYFAVEFPNHNTYIVKTTDETYNVGRMALRLKFIDGFRGYNETIYNPLHYISVTQLGEPNEKQKRLARTLTEVFV